MFSHSMRALTIFLATAGGAGYSPIAPGTAGSVVGLVLVWLAFAPLWVHSPPLFLIVFAILFTGACRVAADAEVIFAEHDSGKIVIDEVLGMAATMFLNPLDWTHLAAGFLIFRAFDIIKPFPADLVDRRLGGGTAVMLDDLVAAVYANLALRALAHFV